MRIDYRNFFYTGSGQARGIDVLLQKQSGRNTGWLSYTLSKVTENFPTLSAGAFPADQDQRHELKIVDIRPVRGWRVCRGTWILSSGRPYTAPGGIETITLPFDESRTFERV